MRSIVGDRLDALAVDLEQHRPALDAAVERRAHRLDARDQHALRPGGSSQPVERLAIQIADVQAERRVRIARLRSGGGRAPAAAIVAAVARRPLRELHRDGLLAAVADEAHAGGGARRAGGDLPNQLIVGRSIA